MTFDPGWFAAVVSTGALILVGVLSSRLRKLESRMDDLQSIIEGYMQLKRWTDMTTHARNDCPDCNSGDLEKTMEHLRKTRCEIMMRGGMDVPPGTRMPEMEERKS